MIEFHDIPYPMTLDWQPNEKLINDLAKHIGLLDGSIDADMLGEFKVYWVGQTYRFFSSYQWHVKFVQHLKRHRTAFRSPSNNVVVSQVVPEVQKTAALVVDQNAKDLIKHYGNS